MNDSVKEQISALTNSETIRTIPRKVRPSGFFNAAANNAERKRLIASARFAWNKLTKSELISTGWNEEKLTELVQHCYAINRSEANKQVKHFLAKFPQK